MSHAFRRAGFAALSLLASATLLALPAAAASPPKRTFVCGNAQGKIIVTVVSQQLIRAKIRMNGNENFTLSMPKQGAGFHFVDGEYEITFAANQNSLVYTAPDFGEISCVWQR